MTSFKLALAVLILFGFLGAALLGFLWIAPATVRYSLHPGPTAMQPMVLDSRTGTVFYIMPKSPETSGVLSVEIHPQTGEVVRHYIWRHDAIAK